MEVLNDNQNVDFGNKDIHDDDDDSSEGSIVDCLGLESEEDAPIEKLAGAINMTLESRSGITANAGTNNNRAAGSARMMRAMQKKGIKVKEAVSSKPKTQMVADLPKKPEPRKPDEISIMENNSTSKSRKKNSQEEITTPTDECRETVEKSREVLDSMKKILEGNELFCSNDRRKEWLKEISGQLNDSEPKTTIGVLGNTGVGKSSLLNALLDEASVLPTSGSRGCTAAVVELRFNADMEKADPTGKQVTCYRGDVEFMTLQEWQTELKILVDECSTHEKTVCA